jgi:hypothetical protein
MAFVLLGAWPPLARKSLEIASFLGPAEKADLAEALTRALLEAHRGPWYG